MPYPLYKGLISRPASRLFPFNISLFVYFHKERSLRRSLEAKASSMEQELKERQRADRTAALTTELLKQTNVNKKKVGMPFKES